MFRLEARRGNRNDWLGQFDASLSWQKAVIGLFSTVLFGECEAGIISGVTMWYSGESERGESARPCYLFTLNYPKNCVFNSRCDLSSASCIGKASAAKIVRQSISAINVCRAGTWLKVSSYLLRVFVIE
jgi:hypothetical protein